MNKKIILTLSLALIAIVMASAVSADENVTIEGITFNIPDGYTEDVDSETINQTTTDEGKTFTSSSKSFDSEDHNMLLLVATYDGENATEAALADIDSANLTIKDIDGKLVDLGFLSIFCYEQDGKLVALTCDSQDEIEKFII